MELRSLSLAFAGCGLLAGLAGAQTYSNNTTDIPQDATGNSSWSENVDFGDVDNDGDWDAVFADGGDNGNDQNRIWINQGFAQGGTLGSFIDRTSTQLPSLVDQSRDIEFVDFDNDGDLDLYVSNTSAISTQSNRWLTNMGGAQAGTTGFYSDETLTRWVGLASANSSLAPGELIGGGGFRDFSCDCDFGDLDNDGDLDLVHSSYGGIFGGQVPTRLFLNDGSGFFSEFNPSGFKLAGQTIANGNPGLWCEGTQSANTVNTTGASCDIASSALDIDVGDIDGDLDIDILHGARQELPRFYQNRHQQTGSLAFRDTTGFMFPAGYSTGDGHYEQEMGDLDGDGDLDLYGLNWRAGGGSFTDITLEYFGGGFTNRVDLSSSSTDDNEGDFVDYDNDGDLDLFVAAFTSQDRLYRNNNNGGASFSMTVVTNSELPLGLSRTALDADAADVDEDGDYDVWVSNDKFFGPGKNLYYENGSVANDTHAPTLFSMEPAANRAAGPVPTVVRVQVYDNAPYYVTWYNPTVLEVTVDAGTPFQIPMRSSAGQIFRGEIPGNLVGNICYRAISADRYGNTGQTGQLCYTATGAGTSFCDASDGALASCPCANPGNTDSGCDNAQATGGVKINVIAQTTSPAGATLTGTGFSTMGSPTSIVLRANSIDPSSPVVFGDGLRCVNAIGLVRLAATVASGGTATHTFGHSAMAGSGAFFYQLWYRNTPSAFCTSAAFNLSNGEQLNW